jgi:hypothetical protein
MLVNIIQNTISSFRSALAAAVVITTNLKMWLGFETSETLGREEVVNGDFSDNTTGWSPNDSTLSVTDNVLEIKADGTGGFGLAQQTITTNSGSSYSLEIKLKKGTHNADVRVGSSSGGSQLLVGTAVSSTEFVTQKYTFTAVSSSSYIMLRAMNSTINSTAYFENLSVKELTQITPDKSGNNNVGELFTGKALEFDGSTTYVSANSFAGTLSTGDAFTFAIWFNSDKTPTDYFRNILISSGGPQQFTNIFKIGVNPQTSATGSANVGGIYFDDSASAYNNVVPLSGGVNYNDGQWHRLVVARRSGSGNKDLSFYVDGSLIGTAPSNPLWNNVNLFDFGQEWDGGGTSDHFGGKISNIQVYDYAWTSDDVTYDYANPNKLAIDNPNTSLSVTNLKGYWALSEGDGLVAYDSGTNLEEEEVVDGDFPLPNVNWGLGDGWSIANNKASNDGESGSNNLRQDDILTLNKSYQIAIEVSDYESGNVEVSAGGAPRGTMTANGTYTFTQVASGSDFFIVANSFVGSVSNVSVREITASDHGGILNGATYVDAQPRIPQLGMMNWSKGSNLLTYSEDFSQSVWTKNNLTETYGFTSPTGLLNATRLRRTSSNSYIDSTINITTVQYNTASIYVKGVSSTIGEDVRLYVYNGTGVSSEAFTLTGDWQRITHTNSSASGQSSMKIKLGIPNVTDGEVLVWAAQLEQSSSASAYRLTDGGATSNSTVIPNPTIPTQDIFGNLVRDRLNSFNLDGSGYAEVADDDDLDIGTGAFTMECWVKADFENTGNALNIIFILGGEYANTDTASIWVNSTTLNARIGSKVLNADSNYTIGDWYHVCVTRDGSNLCTLYIDAEAQLDTETASESITNTSTKLIGRDTLTTRFYKNLISDVRLYKGKALTSDEIENNYNAGLSAHTN